MSEKSEMKDFLNVTSKKLSKTLGSDVDLSKTVEVVESRRIPTGIYQLDRALMGGIAMSKFMMIAGRYHAGKTSAMCRIIAEAQKKYPERVAIFVDMEDHFDPRKAEDMGVDLDRLKIIQLYTAGEVSDHICDILNDYAHLVSVICIDSLPSCTDIRMLDSKKGADGHHIANIAKPISTMLNFIEVSMRAAKARGDIAPAIVAANHYRVNMDAGPYGPKIKLAGGDIPSQRSYLTILLDPVKNPDYIGRYDDENDEMGYMTVNAKIHKCKLDVNPPKSVEFTMCIGAMQRHPPGSIDPMPLIRRLVKEGYITRSIKDPEFKNIDFAPDVKFAKKDDIGDYLVKNPEFRQRLESLSIQNYRELKGKPRLNPSEDYMIIPVTKEDASKQEAANVEPSGD